MKLITDYPTPIAGLTLGMIGICIFWVSLYPEVLVPQITLMIITMMVLLMLLPLGIKFILYPAQLWNDLSHPTIGSVVPTLAMSLMLISHILLPLNRILACSIWLMAILLHVSFFCIFCFHRMKNIDLNHMVPSWFIPPIGIVVACISVPSSYFLTLAHIILLFGMVAYAIMLPTMLYRLCLKDSVEDARKPTLAILAAPASLTLAGYLSLTQHPNALIVLVLFSIALLMTLSVYLMLLHLLKLGFSPAYSAFTFPLVISATATYKMSQWLQTTVLLGNYSTLFFLISFFEGVIATVVIIYVFQHYMRHILVPLKSRIKQN